MSYLGIFRLKSEKTLSYMKLAPSNFPKCKNLCKTKTFQIWDQNYLIQGFFGCNFEKLLSYLKSALLNQANHKVCEKRKKPKFGTKNALFGCALGRNFKKLIVLFEISTLCFVKNEFLANTVNFVIGSAFSKDPGSAFSKGPFRVWICSIKHVCFKYFESCCAEPFYILKYSVTQLKKTL